MKYIILDTCIWIELAQDKYSGALFQLEKLVDDKKVNLLIPEQIRNEWNNGKAEKVKQDYKGKIKGVLSSVRSLNEYLDNGEKETLSELISSVEQNKEDYGEKKANNFIDRVEKLMGIGITCKTSTENKIKAVDLALAKKAPFDSKNQMGDALIILSSIEYLKDNNLQNEAFFITANIRDFGDKKNPKKLHLDLIPLFESVGLQYSINIKETFKLIDELIVTDKEIEDVEKILMYSHPEIPINLGIPSCPTCGISMLGSYMPSNHGGWTWHWVCPENHVIIDAADAEDY